jgi:hypothetical protein
MNPSERFAAECELMAKYAESQETWHGMAERWIRCAELFARQSSAAHSASLAKRHN